MKISTSCKSWKYSEASHPVTRLLAKRHSISFAHEACHMSKRKDASVDYCDSRLTIPAVEGFGGLPCDDLCSVCRHLPYQRKCVPTTLISAMESFTNVLAVHNVETPQSPMRTVEISYAGQEQCMSKLERLQD